MTILFRCDERTRSTRTRPKPSTVATTMLLHPIIPSQTIPKPTQIHNFAFERRMSYCLLNYVYACVICVSVRLFTRIHIAFMLKKSSRAAWQDVLLYSVVHTTGGLLGEYMHSIYETHS